MIITLIISEKKNIIRLIVPLVILLIVSCNVRHGNIVSTALTFAEADKPDSAILILKGINRKELSNSDEAMYALAYTIAQDKSGITWITTRLLELLTNGIVRNQQTFLVPKVCIIWENAML